MKGSSCTMKHLALLALALARAFGGAPLALLLALLLFGGCSSLGGLLQAMIAGVDSAVSLPTGWMHGPSTFAAFVLGILLSFSVLELALLTCTAGDGSSSMLVFLTSGGYHGWAQCAVRGYMTGRLVCDWSSDGV